MLYFKGFVSGKFYLAVTCSKCIERQQKESQEKSMDGQAEVTGAMLGEKCSYKLTVDLCLTAPPETR